MCVKACSRTCKRVCLSGGSGGMLPQILNLDPLRLLLTQSGTRLLFPTPIPTSPFLPNLSLHPPKIFGTFLKTNMQAKTKNQQYNIHFQNKTSIFKDGSLQTENGRTPQQIYIYYHPYILCHFCILLTHAHHIHAPPPPPSKPKRVLIDEKKATMKSFLLISDRKTHC